jgi:hypothetical protein
MAGLACPHDEPLPNPSQELIAAALAAGDIENHAFRIVHRRELAVGMVACLPSRDPHHEWQAQAVPAFNGDAIQRH